MSGLWSTNNYSSDIINMNILVTGANGQLGQAIRAQSHRLQNHNIVFTDVIERYVRFQRVYSYGFD